AEILLHAVDDELVRQPACLRAGAAVGAPPADGLARQALPRVRDAERAVDEDLDLDRRLPPDARDVLERELARQDHAARAEGAGERGLVEVVRAGAGVEPFEPKINGVRARAYRRAHGAGVAGGREDLGPSRLRHARTVARKLDQSRRYIVTTQAPPRPRLCWR